MTKAKLESIREIKKELTMWEKRYKEIADDIAPQVKINDGLPYSKTNAVGHPTEEKAIKLADAAAQIEAKIQELRSTIIEIESFILSVDDSIMRQILEYRCVYGMSWDDVADKLGGNASNGMAKMAYYRFIQDKEL